MNIKWFTDVQNMFVNNKKKRDTLAEMCNRNFISNYKFSIVIEFLKPNMIVIVISKM